jgi:hypothetical protein
MCVYDLAAHIPLIGQLEDSHYSQCCGSGMFIRDPGSEFFHHGTWILIEKIPDPGSGSASKIEVFLTQKISKLSEI